MANHAKVLDVSEENRQLLQSRVRARTVSVRYLERARIVLLAAEGLPAAEIGQVLADSPFTGDGYRKVRARLPREHGIHVSGKRVLGLMRRERLLAQQAHDRAAQTPPA